MYFVDVKNFNRSVIPFMKSMLEVQEVWIIQYITSTRILNFDGIHQDNLNNKVSCFNLDNIDTDIGSTWRKTATGNILMCEGKATFLIISEL